MDRGAAPAAHPHSGPYNSTTALHSGRPLVMKTSTVSIVQMKTLGGRHAMFSGVQGASTCLARTGSPGHWVCGGTSSKTAFAHYAPNVPWAELGGSRPHRQAAQPLLRPRARFHTVGRQAVAACPQAKQARPARPPQAP
eukprot:365377-Chlamydomonas_euryale.AAC.29